VLSLLLTTPARSQVQVTCHELQAALNDSQLSECAFASELQDGLRKECVFESSTLANEQVQPVSCELRRK
jgi:hypothetical protein